MYQGVDGRDETERLRDLLVFGGGWSDVPEDNVVERCHIFPGVQGVL